jgi:hypothetical protein
MLQSNPSEADRSISGWTMVRLTLCLLFPLSWSLAASVQVALMMRKSVLMRDDIFVIGNLMINREHFILPCMVFL